jgi:hypothetical protein
MINWRKSIAAAHGLAVASLLFAPPGIATAGEGVFQKFGDGLRHGVEDILTPNKVDEKPSTAPANSAPGPQYSATYRVDCRDAQTGADRADNTITATSPVSEGAARAYILDLASKSDLCQANGDTSRVTKRGSGRWM